MGTQHQPRRNDAQRIIDRQTRARREIMRRAQLEIMHANMEAIQEFIDEGPLVPVRALNEVRSAHHLAWYHRAARATRSFLADTWAAVVDAFPFPWSSR